MSSPDIQTLEFEFFNDEMEWTYIERLKERIHICIDDESYFALLSLQSKQFI